MDLISVKTFVYKILEAKISKSFITSYHEVVVNMSIFWSFDGVQWWSRGWCHWTYCAVEFFIYFAIYRSLFDEGLRFLPCIDVMVRSSMERKVHDILFLLYLFERKTLHAQFGMFHMIYYREEIFTTMNYFGLYRFVDALSQYLNCNVDISKILERRQRIFTTLN